MKTDSASPSLHYLERLRWPKGPVCPACGEKEQIGNRAERSQTHRCNSCKLDFSVRTGTILERSRVPLEKWVIAIEAYAQDESEQSSPAFAEKIGTTQKTAWFVRKRLQEALGELRKAIPPETAIKRVLAHRAGSKGAWAKRKRAETRT